MGSYMMGYYYDIPQRGLGHSLLLEGGCSRGNLLFSAITLKSANEIKQQMIREGKKKENIIISKNSL